MPVWKAMRVALLPALWAATALMMARDWARDPYNPKLDVDEVYGHNGEDALGEVLVLTVIELVVLIAIVRPWSYERSWGRSLVAVALLLPWAGLSMIFSMHQGGIVILHFMWIFLALVGLVITFLVSAISVYRSPRSR